MNFYHYLVSIHARILALFLILNGAAFSAQCVISTTPNLSAYDLQDATNTFATGNIKLAGSTMGFTFTNNANLVTKDQINDDHFTNEYGINIEHASGTAINYNDRISGRITFTSAVSGLKFRINDIDAGDRLRIRAFNENNNEISIPANSFYSFYSGTVVTYNSSIQEFHGTGNSGANSRTASVNFNFPSLKISRIEFDYYDDNGLGTITFANFTVPCITAHNDVFSTRAGVNFVTSSVFNNDTVNGSPANSSNTTVAPIGNLPAGIALNSSNGTITINNTTPPGFYVLNYSICQTGFADNCVSATASVVVERDTDGDTISDINDLDDDNDGILDSTECPVSNLINNGTFDTNLNGWTAGTGWTHSAVNGGVATNETDSLTAGGILSQAISNLNKAENGIVSVNLTVGARDFGSNPGNTASLDVMLNGVVYATLNNSTLRDNSNISITLLNGATSNFIPYGTDGATTYRNSNPFTIHIPYNGPASATLAFRMFSGGDDWSVDNISVNAHLCDTDNDGTPNHLDLDSDGDGCYDAIEGTDKVTKTQVNINGAITGTVNINGVPNLVNPGGLADIDGAVGQGIGTSENSAIKNIECADVFGCGSTMYLSQTDKLYSVGNTTNPFTYPLIGTSSVSYNALGLNPLDGRLYGMQTSGSSNILVINPNGTSINLGPVTGLPVGTYIAGEIDNFGNYYVKANTNNNELYKINLNTLTATLITLSSSNTLPDFAFRVLNGLLYGVNSVNGQLISIDPNNGLVVEIGITPGAVSFGAMFASSTGEIYGADNAGAFYQFSPTSGDRILISTAPPSNANDGAHCVTSPIVFSTDLAVTKSDGITSFASGTTTTYTITVSNNGPFGVLNATVVDMVPAGIPSTNVTYTAVASAGSTTAVHGVQTGAIGDVVGLPVGGTLTYTVVVNIPIGFNGNLTNTVNVAPPANVFETNYMNNSAADINTQTVCYRSALITGSALDAVQGISSLNKSSVEWPMARRGAWTVLEAKTKGFVPNRLTNAQISAIPAENLVAGMMVYNTNLDCLQINTTGTPSGWSCFNVQTCPTN